VNGKKREAENRQLEKRHEEFVSEVVQRDLPRPFPVASARLYQNFEEKAEQLVVEEMMRIAVHDAKTYSGQRKSANCTIVPPHPVLERYLSEFEECDESDLAAAELLDWRGSWWCRD
jgi:5'-deoxynucleotidase YfbR-like HD superfamily hydrolase